MKTKSMTNEELSATALDCLEELEHRGNRDIESARRTVFLFHENVLSLKARAAALSSIGGYDDATAFGANEE